MPIKSGGISPRSRSNKSSKKDKPLGIISSDRNIRNSGNLDSSFDGSNKNRSSSSTVSLSSSSGGRISPKSGRSMEFNSGINKGSAISLGSSTKRRQKPKKLSPRLDDLSPRSDSSKPRSPINGLKPVSGKLRPSPKNSSSLKLSSSLEEVAAYHHVIPFHQQKVKDRQKIIVVVRVDQVGNHVVVGQIIEVGR